MTMLDIFTKTADGVACWRTSTSPPTGSPTTTGLKGLTMTIAGFRPWIYVVKRREMSIIYFVGFDVATFCLPECFLQNMFDHVCNVLHRIKLPSEQKAKTRRNCLATSLLCDVTVGCIVPSTAAAATSADRRLTRNFVVRCDTSHARSSGAGVFAYQTTTRGTSLAWTVTKKARRDT